MQELSEPSTKHLNQIISCLRDSSYSPVVGSAIPENIKSLYDFTQGVIHQFEMQAIKCKKYNEAKIHRKYQIDIADLQQQVKVLKQKLKIQQDVRPSSRKHVADLVDKMVALREENELFKQQIQFQKLIIQKLNLQIDPVQRAQLEKKEENPENQQHLKQVWEKKQLSETVRKYLNRKNTMQGHPMENNFEKFVRLNAFKISRWNLDQLFVRIEKWSTNLRDIRNLNHDRIRSKVLENSTYRPIHGERTIDYNSSALSSKEITNYQAKMILKPLKRRNKYELISQSQKNMLADVSLEN